MLHAQYEDRGFYEEVGGGSSIQFGDNATAFIGAPGGDRYCPPCDGIDFLYGVPFSLRIRARSVIGYTYDRTADSQQTMAGQALGPLNSGGSYVEMLELGYVRAGSLLREDPNARLSEVSADVTYRKLVKIIEQDGCTLAIR